MCRMPSGGPIDARVDRWQHRGMPARSEFRDAIANGYACAGKSLLLGAPLSVKIGLSDAIQVTFCP